MTRRYHFSGLLRTVKAQALGFCAVAYCLTTTLPFLAPSAIAAGVAEENKAANPPLFPSTATNCQAAFKLKPAAINDHHAFVVITAPDGKLLELRGGPSKGGGSTVPGSATSGDQPSGNPFNCTTTHQWGVVVPYIGKHGRIGTGSGGVAIYSPDGLASDHVFSVAIGRGAQPNVCALANCMMNLIKAMGASCKIYTVGTGVLRNSNTLISQALASCGVPDPHPPSRSVPGWGNRWN